MKSKSAESDLPAVSAEAVRQMALSVGIELKETELEEAATNLQQMFHFERQLDSLDLDGVAPAAVFDPAWELQKGPKGV